MRTCFRVTGETTELAGGAFVRRVRLAAGPVVDQDVSVAGATLELLIAHGPARALLARGWLDVEFALPTAHDTARREEETPHDEEEGQGKEKG